MAVVYSVDCPAGVKHIAADGAYVFQATGTADQTVINSAINAVQATGQTSSTKPTGGGGAVLLAGFNFNITAPILLQSWVDLGGAFGAMAAQVNASSGFAGTAMIQDAQTYTERTKLHDLFLDGKGIGSAHGIYRNSQVSQTPFTYSDPKHHMWNLNVFNPGGGGIVFGTSVRSTMLRDCMIEQSSGWGIDGTGLVDSIVSGIHMEGCGTAGSSGGLLAANAATSYSGMRVYNSHGYGIEVSGTRTTFTNCGAIDSSFHNWFITVGKIALSCCFSDSAGLGNPNTYDGFNINSVGNLSLTGCQSYDRNGSPHQRDGVHLNGSCTQSRIQCSTYGNQGSSFGGTTSPGSGSVYDVYGT